MTPDPSTGQILPGSKFGDKLTELAREAKVIVEIGTWKGGGSTQCLRVGIHRADQWVITIEANIEMHQIARRHPDSQGEANLLMVWGTIVLPEEFPPYSPNVPSERDAQYRIDKALIELAPYCLPIIPAEIDLLLLDGGEWTSYVEFTKLKHRSKVIALDDTNEAKSIKNYIAREEMIDNGWLVLADEPDDRNGWFIGRRP